MSNKWNLRFLSLAKEISTWSKDPSTKVGAVIVDDNRRIVSTGYNGLPKIIDDSYDRLHNRDLKLNMILHAEENALLFAKTDLSGCTIYTTPLAPCSKCCVKIIQSGISHIVAQYSDNPLWQDSLNLAKDLFTEAGISYRLYNNEELVYWNNV